MSTICLTHSAHCVSDADDRVIILVVGAGIPLIATLFSLLFPSTTLKLKPYIVYPIIYRHHLAIWKCFHLPNLGQTIYITLFVNLNIVLSSVGYSSVQPSTWYATTTQEMVSKIAARTGVIAMALAPLTFLFAGRNNILLYLTNWNHATYILLHRWIARLFTLHVIIHSIAELWAYVDMDAYSENLVQEYWIWGCVATVASVVMCIKSIFRVWKYELFLVLHIILAVFVLAGTWYHLIYRFDYRWGYHYMLYACFAIWAWDRILRIILLLRNGRQIARLTLLGNVVRVDMENIGRMDGRGLHGYAYFPFVSKWTPWESHPFSIIPSHLLAKSDLFRSGSNLSGNDSPGASTPGIDKEKNINQDPIRFDVSPSLGRGITFYVKAHNGMTGRLANLGFSRASTMALVEGPYGHGASLQVDRLILIAGGVGITAVLPYWAVHHNAKLYWSVKSPMQALVDDLSSTALWCSGKEKEVRVGNRFNVNEVIECELERYRGSVVGVVVCGPKSMCEDVRRAVVKLGKKGSKIEFRCEAFSW